MTTNTYRPPCKCTATPCQSVGLCSRISWFVFAGDSLHTANICIRTFGCTRRYRCIATFTFFLYIKSLLQTHLHSHANPNAIQTLVHSVHCVMPPDRPPRTPTKVKRGKPSIIPNSSLPSAFVPPRSPSTPSPLRVTTRYPTGRASLFNTTSREGVILSFPGWRPNGSRPRGVQASHKETNTILTNHFEGFNDIATEHEDVFGPVRHFDHLNELNTALSQALTRGNKSSVPYGTVSHSHHLIRGLFPPGLTSSNAIANRSTSIKSSLSLSFTTTATDTVPHRLRPSHGEMDNKAAHLFCSLIFTVSLFTHSPRDVYLHRAR